MDYTTPSSGQIASRLTHLVTQYDQKQAGKRFYNPNALALYLGSIQDNVVPALASGQPLADALEAGFNDRVLSFLQRELKREGYL